MSLTFDADYMKYAAGQEVFFSNFLYNHFVAKAIEHNTAMGSWSVEEGKIVMWLFFTDFCCWVFFAF